MEVWREIEEFPGYSVSDTGFVRNDETGRLLTRLVNQRGILYVGLSKDRIQHKRSVSSLVVDAFLEKPKLEAFDTPINLDGDRTNNHIENLVLRPRWFAVKYNQQFDRPPQGIRAPVRILETGEEFKTSWDAAIKYGLLDKDILINTQNGMYVWPTFQTFQKI